MYYEVRGGDTLSAIARRHGTSIDELQRINRIADPDRIRAGQRLELPARQPGDATRPGAGPAAARSPSAEVPLSGGGATPAVAGAAGAPGAATAGASANAGGAAEPWSTTVFRFVDAIGRPIVGLLVRLRSAGGTEMVAESDADGCVVPFRCDAPGEGIEIHVGRAAHEGGGQKQVGSYVPLPGHQTVKVESAKQVATTRPRRHEGPPAEPPQTMKREKSGAAIETATREGNPLTCVKCGECPNDEDLKLGVNAEYREAIVAAAKRAGILPQAVAALINAEAAKERGGRWDQNSMAGTGSAAGLTQFLDRTWIGEAVRPNTYLHQQALQRNWLNRDNRGLLRFHRADGGVVTEPELARKLVGLLHGSRRASDANLQSLLDLRYEPEASIHAAMDYAASNIRHLAELQYDVDGLDDVQRVRLMYLCHQLGPADGIAYIENTMTAARAEELLVAQVRRGRAETICKDLGNGNWVRAHRRWLADFIKRLVVPAAFTCPGARQHKLEDQGRHADLLSVVGRIGRGRRSASQ